MNLSKLKKADERDQMKDNEHLKVVELQWEHLRVNLLASWP